MRPRRCGGRRSPDAPRTPDPACWLHITHPALFGEPVIMNIASLAKSVAKIAAPMAAEKVFGMIPGVGVLAGPLAGKLTRSLLNKAAAEAK